MTQASCGFLTLLGTGCDTVLTDEEEPSSGGSRASGLRTPWGFPTPSKHVAGSCILSGVFIVLGAPETPQNFSLFRLQPCLFLPAPVQSCRCFWGYTCAYLWGLSLGLRSGDTCVLSCPGCWCKCSVLTDSGVLTLIYLMRRSRGRCVLEVEALGSGLARFMTQKHLEYSNLLLWAHPLLTHKKVSYDACCSVQRRRIETCSQATPPLERSPIEWAGQEGITLDRPHSGSQPVW